MTEPSRAVQPSQQGLIFARDDALWSFAAGMQLRVSWLSRDSLSHAAAWVLSQRISQQGAHAGFSTRERCWGLKASPSQMMADDSWRSQVSRHFKRSTASLPSRSRACP
eukprot:scaffold986_cov237-Pinguiococcus_pyrenoidosus.AAC.15